MIKEVLTAKSKSMLTIAIIAVVLAVLGGRAISAQDKYTVQVPKAIGLAPAEDFRRDPDLFGEGVRNPEAQSRIQAAMKYGFQTRDAETDLARMLGDLADH